jgi:hypothetical protein
MGQKIFSISGRWVDDESEFSGYKVTDYDSTPEGWDDDLFFFYGISEEEIRDSIDNGTAINGEFVITEYEDYDEVLENN